METEASQLSNQPGSKKPLAAQFTTPFLCLLLAVLFFLVRYLHINTFGWYEDDLTIIPNAVTMSASELFAYVWSYIYHLYGHGRPLSDSLIYIFSHYGWIMDGITGGYWIGYIIEAVNLVLYFLLLQRLHSPRFAIIGSLAYLLYSADTTQAFLTHSLGLHPSITLLLLAFHGYLSGKKMLAYGLIFIILFSYETPYLIFAAAPLLTLQGKPWKSGWWKDLLRHWAILASALVAIYILRTQIGEGRVGDLTTWQIITTPFIHAAEGPVVALGTYFYRPIQAIQSINLEMIVLMAGCFVIFWSLLTRIQGRPSWSEAQVKASLSGLRPSVWFPSARQSLSLPENLPDEFQRLLRLAAAGIVMILAAYPLTFTVRAYAISGRDTRVHAAAVVGAAFLWACLGTFLIQAAESYHKKFLAVLPLAALFALLAGYGLVVQRDYTQGWTLQQEFWTEILPLIEDAGPDTVILIEPTGLADSRQIGANTWNLPRILNQIYTFPSDWKNPPRVFRLSDNWQNQILDGDGLFHINAATSVAPPSLYCDVDPQDIIFIETKNGRLTRRVEPLPLGDETYTLKAEGESILPNQEHGFLYFLLIQPAEK